MFQFNTMSDQPARFVSNRIGEPPEATAKSRALLNWREHCVECAAPACYTTCDLFDPTPLGKCRRFDFGIQSVPAAPRHLAEIHFRKWGKLETKGSAIPIPVRRLDRLERIMHRVTPPLDRLGAGLAKLSGDSRWANLSERLGDWLQRRQSRQAPEAGAALPDCFLAEILNPGAEPIDIQLSIVIDQANLPRAIPIQDQPRPFRRSIKVEPGHNSCRVPGEEFAPILASGLPFLIQLTVDGDAQAHLVFGTLDFIWSDKSAQRQDTPADSAGTARPLAKCVVFDLDNTVWDGVLLEGPVTLRPPVADLFRQLDERGILLSVASKNAESDALARLREAGLEEYLLFPQIGWDPKSVSLKRLAARLDIGIDSFIFVDDNPFERMEVADALPSVEVLPDTALAGLVDHPRLRGNVTAESKRRRSMYKEAAERESIVGEFSDFRSFLQSCEIVLEIRPDQPEDFERIGELVQRTNQLNFSGRKYGREAIGEILSDPARARFVVTARDRFGSYGTVGFCLASRDDDTIRVEDFMLSCRVQGKYVEQALFDFLAGFFGDPPPRRMEVNFVPTERNAAAHNVLKSLAFEPQDDGRFARALEPGDLAVDFLTINP